MLVKTLRKHNNPHGEKFTKIKGIIYEHPAPLADIQFGLVEAYNGTAKIQGRKRVRKKADGADNSDSEKQNTEGGESGTGSVYEKG